MNSIDESFPVGADAIEDIVTIFIYCGREIRGMDEADEYWLSQIPEPKKPRLQAKAMKSVMRRWLTNRGVANQQAAALSEQAWCHAVGDLLASQTRCGPLKRGVLIIVVSNNLAMQELCFQKKRILQKLTVDLPDFKIRDIRFTLEESGC